MCVLHVGSKTCSFRKFLKTTELPVYKSHEKGDKPFKTKPPYEYYGFSCTFSEKDWDDLAGQVEDALSFLKEYEKELSDLINTYTIDDIRFDFPYNCWHTREIYVQCNYLPPELLLRAGKLNIGIELSLYPKREKTIMDKISEKIDLVKKYLKPKSAEGSF